MHIFRFSFKIFFLGFSFQIRYDFSEVKTTTGLGNNFRVDLSEVKTETGLIMFLKVGLSTR